MASKELTELLAYTGRHAAQAASWRGVARVYRNNGRVMPARRAEALADYHQSKADIFRGAAGRLMHMPHRASVQQHP